MSGLDLAKAHRTCLGDRECTGVVEYPGRSIYDPPSYYICDSWMCPVSTKPAPAWIRQNPTVHVPLTFPAQQEMQEIF